MGIKEYIRESEKKSNFVPTGMTKRFYIDIIEKCLDAYSFQEIENRLPEENGFVDDLQAYSRITCALGVMLAHGKKTEYKDLWVKMMDACCRDFYRRTPPNTLDFAVKEIMLSYKAMKDHVSPEKRREWLDLLQKIDPDQGYTIVLREDVDPETVRNWNVYNMAGEYLRETEELTDTTEYFKKHWPHQTHYFDENGMYMDPHNPMLYDLTTRCHLQLITGFGYRGEFFASMDEQLKKAGLYTLFMQSAAFEFPYGGRSNQYLFNEALIAANCEYEAVRYAKEGDAKTAGMFKRAGHLAVRAMLRWLNENPPRHIKNFYPVDSKFGTEGYGYYDKYMMTVGSFIYIAYLFADDKIEEFPCPAEMGGSVLQTSEAFHKVFANCCGQSVEIDTKADSHYDATGLGRFHKSSCPSELALSMPFTATPNYTLPEHLNKRNLSLCAGIRDKAGNILFLSELDEQPDCTVTVKSEQTDKVELELFYSGSCFKTCKGIKETYTLDKNGLLIASEIIAPETDKIYYAVPIFLTNGKDTSNVEYAPNKITVTMGQYRYTVESDGIYAADNGRYGNRNGEYRLAVFQKDSNKITLRLKIDHL